MAKQIIAKPHLKMLQLQDNELKLFRSYNRHAEAAYKLRVLNELIVTINKIEVLKEILS